MSLIDLSRSKCNKLYNDVLSDHDYETMRDLCRSDLFFLLTRGCNRKDIDNDWLFARCREVEASPDNMLDLWARDHYKSTIITYGLTIQNILNDPTVTVGIFSHTRPIAKAFLSQIKTEFEDNDFLKSLFPEILYRKPRHEASNWSMDSGITVNRDSNAKEPTVSAYGLVDGQPTSKHFRIMVYDDVVTRESVTTPEMIKKVTGAWELSLSLMDSRVGVCRYIGTRYHFGDTWHTIMDRGVAIPRIHASTHNGKIDGNPVFLTKEKNDEKIKGMGSYTYGCQYLQDPKADASQGFKSEWLRFWDVKTLDNLNIYIVVDPANAKKKTSDYTAMWVIGLGEDKNYYAIDIVRDKLNLTERTSKLIELHRKYKPKGVGYEMYGKDSDIQHIEYVQAEENYRFEITPMGGKTSKEDRIRRLIPVYENSRMFLPKTAHYIDHENKHKDLTQVFVAEEYNPFPVGLHDDLIDSQARILDKDLNVKFPDTNRKNTKQISKLINRKKSIMKR